MVDERTNSVLPCDLMLVKLHSDFPNVWRFWQYGGFERTAGLQAITGEKSARETDVTRIGTTQSAAFTDGVVGPMCKINGHWWFL